MLRRASTFRCKKLDKTEVGGVEKQRKKAYSGTLYSNDGLNGLL